MICFSIRNSFCESQVLSFFLFLFSIFIIIEKINSSFLFFSKISDNFPFPYAYANPFLNFFLNLWHIVAVHFRAPNVNIEQKVQVFPFKLLSKIQSFSIVIKFSPLSNPKSPAVHHDPFTQHHIGDAVDFWNLVFSQLTTKFCFSSFVQFCKAYKGQMLQHCHCNLMQNVCISPPFYATKMHCVFYMHWSRWRKFLDIFSNILVKNMWILLHMNII